MKNLSIEPGLLPSIIKLPTSKSYANRALILAALKEGPCTLKDLPEASDVTFLVTALKQAKLEIHQSHNEITILNSFPACEQNGARIDVGEGGTTARFLASMLALGSKPYILKLGQRLKERPWDELIQVVNQLGGKAVLANHELFIQGPIKIPPRLEIDCKRTTQVASGFQLAAAFTGQKIEPIHLTTSQSYWKMTEHLIKQFKTSSTFQVPIDWSSASYPMAFAALKQPIFFPGLFFDTFQADAKFFTLLHKLGAIVEKSDGVEVQPIKVRESIQFDVQDCLDLVPTLAFYLSHIPGQHTLRGVQNLIHKESNRLEEIQKLLEKFQRKTQTDGVDLIIWGSEEIFTQKIDLTLPEDHRMVMTGALFERIHHGGTISPVEAVQKSYPSFFELFNT